MVMCEGTCVLIMRIMLLRLLLRMMLLSLDKHKHKVVVLSMMQIYNTAWTSRLMMHYLIITGFQT